MNEVVNLQDQTLAGITQDAVGILFVMRAGGCSATMNESSRKVPEIQSLMAAVCGRVCASALDSAAVPRLAC
jgi:hypothetical protein